MINTIDSVKRIKQAFKFQLHKIRDLINLDYHLRFKPKEKVENQSRINKIIEDRLNTNKIKTFNRKLKKNPRKNAV